MSPVDIDPNARTLADDRPSPGTDWSAKVTTPVDPRADTLPSDAAFTTPAPASAENDPMIGRMLGHFRVDAIIGRGGMGTVYRAWDVSLHRPVALKVLLTDSPTARQRFLREARSQAQLRHPNVVPIHYVGESEGTVFLVMELVEGESLTDLIRREGRVAPDRALDIVDAVASALAAGHAEGIIHRDVKPSNILIEKSGRALLADFGLAKDISSAMAGDPAFGSGVYTGPSASDTGAPSMRSQGLTRAGAIVGTPAYLAPEQAAGGRVDHRADMYALGASLFEALTGAPPFDAPTPTGIVARQQSESARSPRAFVSDLHPALEQLVLRLLQRDPDARFGTYDELREAVGEARMPTMIKAPPVPRLVAFFIDYFVFAFLGGILYAGMLAFGLPYRPIAWVVVVVAAALIEWHFAGSSLGKRLMQMRTADRYGLRPGFGAILARTAYKALGPALPWAFGLVLPSWLFIPICVVATLLWIASFLPVLGKKGLSLHDRITVTRVIFAEPKTPRRRAPAPKLPPAK